MVFPLETLPFPFTRIYSSVRSKFRCHFWTPSLGQGPSDSTPWDWHCPLCSLLDHELCKRREHIHFSIVSPVKQTYRYLCNILMNDIKDFGREGIPSCKKIKLDVFTSNNAFSVSFILNLSPIIKQQQVLSKCSILCTGMIQKDQVKILGFWIFF